MINDGNNTTQTVQYAPKLNRIVFSSISHRTTKEIDFMPFELFVSSSYTITLAAINVKMNIGSGWVNGAFVCVLNDRVALVVVI